MFTERIGDAFGPPIGRVVRLVAHISPDVLTITGLALNGVACACFAFSGGKDYRMPELLRAGGLVALVASVFDMLDGRVARSEEHTSELQSPCNLVCSLLFYDKKTNH